MRHRSVLAALGALALLVPLQAEAKRPRPSWIVSAGGDLGGDAMRERYGVDPRALADVEPFWEGDMLFDRDSATEAMLELAGGSPQHAEAYEPSPGILYVEMNGVTLQPTCGNGDQANAARNCSPLVSSETVFPPYGQGGQQAAVFQELANYYEPFNVVMTTSRPPEWVPYTMAVIGGSAALAGLGGGTCGVANVACDGLKRNHVSLTFPQSCGGVAEIAAQETAHNWGLEHTSNQTDLMYPTLTGGFKTFVDQCMNISHATGNGVTQCGYIHENYCPAGEGEQQNSYAELMGVFGPRQQDTIPPQILTLEPEDGAAFATTDSFRVRGTVEENTNFIAMKFTVEGAGEAYTICTNNMCDDDFNLPPGFDPNGVTFEAFNVAQPPEGEYTVTYEVMDAYGGYDARTHTFYVNESGEPPMTTDPTDPSGSGSDTDDTASGTDGMSTEGESDPMPNDDDDGPGTDTDPGLVGPDDPKGCACRSGSTTGGLLFLLLGGTLRRRRR